MRSKDDDDAFAEAMAGVRPRQPSARLVPIAPPPEPRARSFEADEAEALRESREARVDDALLAAGDLLSYRAPGVQDAVFRKLKRGTYARRAELDLHGLTAVMARAAVRDFLADCAERDFRCVRIVHGKGLRSPGEGPVLKSLLDGLLRKRRDVLAFHSAPPKDGGAGAVYVLLRPPGAS